MMILKANMSCHKIRIQKNKENAREIQGHLEACDHSFEPALSSYVNIPEYATKLFSRSITFEAWSHDVLIGLLAFYVDAEGKTVFISNISIVPEMSSKGMGKYLMKRLLGFMKADHLSIIELETFPSNEIALRFYTALGFHRVAEVNNKVALRMEIRI
jgi:ribosomal protein S18 acetylase RimI-like enzyme